MIASAPWVIPAVLIGAGSLLWLSSLLPFPLRRRDRAALQMSVGMHPAARTTLPALRPLTAAERRELADIEWGRILAVLDDPEAGRG